MHSLKITKKLVRLRDSLIGSPHWQNRKDSGATYIWSFDIPIKDLKRYCDASTNDYRSPIVTQFRNYLENELPLRKEVKVFHWPYVDQTEQDPL